MNMMRSFMQIVEGATAVPSILSEGAIPLISPREARERKLFGPVYHGTSDIDAIMQNGFDVSRAEDGRANGYPFQPYSPGGRIPAPVHHLGYGVYFTSTKAIAKGFNGNSVKGMKEFWLDVPNTLEINFASPAKMMNWWHQNGYNPSDDILARRDYSEWYAQTRSLTDHLRSHYDAVWFKGKGMRRLLDGDQICVYDPSRIYAVDNSLAGELEVGAKVVHNQSKNPTYGRGNEMYVDTVDNDTRYTGWKAYYRAVDWDGNDLPKAQAHPLHMIPPPGMVGTIVAVREGSGPRAGQNYYDVKWAKGGVQHNYVASELSPAPLKKARAA